jgi:hypothetical protein
MENRSPLFSEEISASVDGFESVDRQKYESAEIPHTCANGKKR